MSLNWPSGGPASVPEYQLSGIPYVSQSIGITAAGVGDESPATITKVPTVCKFPYVTRWVQITNMGAQPLRIGFTRNGVLGNGCGLAQNSELSMARNYFVLPAKAAAADGSSSTVRLELRCTELHMLSQHGSTTGKAEIIAGLTTVHHSQFPVLTGSTYTEAAFADRRNPDGTVSRTQIQAPLFQSGSSGLG